VDICPTDCLTIVANADQSILETRLTAPRTDAEQPLFVSAALQQTGRVMVKDENVCVHCGLCAERCPTYAWDMRRSVIHIPLAGEPVSIPALA
jgi:NAD-dependent dihydropyrimidine dehydrogenase PreA subunit